MKINEFRIDEGFLDVLHQRVTGRYPSGNNRESRIDARAQQGFINKFVTSTISAIEGGLGKTINPNPNARPRIRPVAETKYEQLNSLLEQLINEAPTHPDTISSFVIRAFFQFMQGVTGLDAIKLNIKKLADQVQRSY